MTDAPRGGAARRVARGVRSVRGRVAIVATLAVGVVLAVVGAVVVTAFAQRELDRVDQRLQEVPPPQIARALLEADLQVGAGGWALRSGPRRAPGPRGTGPGAPPPGPGAVRALPAGDFARLTAPDGSVLAGAGAPADLPTAREPGLRTVEASGERYRVRAEPLPGGRMLELGADLAPVDASIADLRTTVILLSLIAVAVTALLAWWLAGLAVRPLAALRGAVARVSGTRDLGTRLGTGRAPAEIDALSQSVNEMLARLQRSNAQTEAALEVTRRFAADVGHELRTPMTALRANLDAVARNPDLDPSERERALAEATAEARRAVRLLETLQTLARGDAGAVLPREPIDLSALVDEAAESARRRHPDVDLAIEAPPRAVVDGWPDGLRALVDNLLENAARHGRAAGRVHVRLRERPADGEGAGGVELRVDDDGPGIPPADRERVFGRFERGDGPADGSGLGLALVRQQANLHGGEATVEDSPLGGAALVVTLANRGATNDGGGR